jgi:uncharacterized protein involved in exopolysaccharide biosynthesis
MHGPEAQYLDRDSDLLPPDPKRSTNFTVNMIWRWRLRFFVVFGVVALVGCPSLFVTQRLYRAQAIVMVGWREPNPLASQQVVRERREQELDVDGEIRLITSPSSLRRVVVDLKLDDRPKFQRGAGTEILSSLRGLFGG